MNNETESIPLEERGPEVIAEEIERVKGQLENETDPEAKQKLEQTLEALQNELAQSVAEEDLQ
jgi:hypothetical protein